MEWQPTMRLVHRADKILANGEVSALCFSTPHVIDLGWASWTNIDKIVTCKNCLRLIAEQKTPNA